MRERILWGLAAAATLVMPLAAAAQDTAPAAGLSEPVISFDLGGVYMTREAPGSQILVVPGIAAPFFNADDFSFGYESGFDADLAVRFAPDWDLEFRGLFPHEWDSSVTYNVAGGGGVFVTDFPIGFMASQLLATYESRLSSMEVNAGYSPTENIRFFAGARFLDLTEKMNFVRSVGAPVFRLTSYADNDLAGAQIGAEGSWELNGLSLGAAIKGGIFSNDVFGRAEVAQPVTDVLGEGSGSSNEISYLVEGEVTAAYQLTQHVSVFAGYSFLWLDNVATASEQFHNTTFGILGNLVSVDLGDVLFHGAKFGLVARF